MSYPRKPKVNNVKNCKLLPQATPSSCPRVLKRTRFAFYQQPLPLPHYKYPTPTPQAPSTHNSLSLSHTHTRSLMSSSSSAISSEPWTAWLTDHAHSFESQALTQALQFSLSPDQISPPPSAAAVPDLQAAKNPNAKPNPTLSPQAGKVAKRKSRAKRTTATTYINADPENFRAMVQMMTGMGGAGPVIRPEPRKQGFLPGSVGPVVVAQEEEEEEGLGFLRFPTLESWGMMV